MWYRFDRKKVRIGSRNFQSAHFLPRGEKHSAARIIRRKSIYGNRVVVKTGQKGLRSRFPEAIFSLHHVVGGLPQFQEKLHFLRLIGLYAESYALVSIQ